MVDEIIVPTKQSNTVRIFSVLLSALMIMMIVSSISALLLGLGFSFSDNFFNTMKDSASFKGLDGNQTSELSRQTLILSTFSGALIAGAFIVIAYLLKRLLVTLITGDPFVPENINRLRKIWIILALTEAFRMVASTMITVMEPSDAMTLDLDIRFTSWFLVFVIATVAEVFRHGAALRQEQQLTI
ncbi:MAG: DUF2975 domain-containing protein [Maricaulaceae bacterium]